MRSTEEAGGSPGEGAAPVGALAERMGIEVLELTADRVVARMPVAGNTQPLGLLHGGASAVLAETAGSLAAQLGAGRGRHAVGTELNVSHHRAVRAGWVTAVATVVHAGRTLASYDVVLTGEDGRRTATARLTCMLRDDTPPR